MARPALCADERGVKHAELTGHVIQRKMRYRRKTQECAADWLEIIPAPTGCDAGGNQTNVSFYNCPSSLGIVTHTIGSPRQIQMLLHLDF